MPLFSVLVPAYNNPESLVKAVRSVTSQTFLDFELLVSDDNSIMDLTSGLTDIIENDTRVKIFRQEKNLGVLGNQLFLLHKATGEYCVFLQHDDFFLEETLFSELSSLIDTSLPSVITGNARVETIDTDNLLFKPEHFPELFLKPQIGLWTKLDGERVVKFLCPPLGAKHLVLSWSSVFFNRNRIMAKKGFSYEYLTRSHLEDKLDIFSSEENMVSIWMLLEEEPFYINVKPISFRGRPTTAFSISPSHPGIGRKNDVEFFNLVRASRLVSSTWLSRAMLRRAKSIGLRRVNLQLLFYLGFSWHTIYTVFLSFLTPRLLRSFRYIRRIQRSAYWRADPRTIILRLIHGPRAPL